METKFEINWFLTEEAVLSKTSLQILDSSLSIDEVFNKLSNESVLTVSGIQFVYEPVSL